MNYSKKLIIVFLCGLISAVTVGNASAASITFAGFGMEANGDAAMAGSILRLTPAEDNHVGSAFIAEPFTIGPDTSFSTAFEFRLHSGGGTGGADGFTFVVQNSAAGNSALGSSGGYLGYQGIGNSFAVEFDTYNNGQVSGSFLDPDNNHIGIDKNGSVISDVMFPLTGFSDLNSGNSVYIWMDYNGATNLLDIYLNDINDKAAYDTKMSTYPDLFALVGNQGFFGFTAATGGLNNAHDIEAWSLTVTGQSVPEPSTMLLLGLGLIGLVGYGRKKFFKR